MNGKAPGEVQNLRLGVAAGLAAFLFWGFAPLYFKELAGVSAGEIIAHRILWSVPVLVLFLLLRDGPGFWRRLLLPWPCIAMLALTGSLVAVNWLIFVWAVNHDQVLATSLGYFINPLVNVLLGLLFLGERLSRLQTVAVAIAAAGTLFLAIDLGQPPWISLALAFSFGFYGLLRKRLPVGPMLGLLWETLLLLTPALIYLLVLEQRGQGLFLQATPGLQALLVGAGLVTVLPLIWYNTATRHLRLSTVGFLQYLAPSISFMLAVWLFDEPFTRGHQVAFACIWLSLLLISSEPWFRARRLRMPV